MNALVTGGAGFIGSNLTRHLAARGEDVRVLDDLSTGSLHNLQHADRPVDVVVGDLRDPGQVRQAVAGVEVVYHIGALPSVARSVAEPQITHGVNVDGTLNVLLAARDAGVRRVVFASSSSVYGDTPTLPKHEDMPPRPQSPYAVSKLAGEAYCRAFTQVYGLETVALRFFNVFGPRQDPSSEYAAVVPRFIAQMMEGEPPVIFGDGRQSRDFTFVDNVVEACVLAASAGPEAVGETVNVGCGMRITLLELVEALRAVLRTEIDPVFREPRPGDVRHSEASIARATQLLAYRPSVTVHQGLAATVDWFAGRAAVAGGRA